mgnify:FL=1|nr:MAG TPA: CCAAT/enhancer-binding protein beta [Caudoviricetes sp.]
MRNWTTKELAYIRKKSLLAETNQVLNAKELASKLQRSIKSVEMKIYAMQRDGQLPKVDLSKSFDPDNRRFSPEDDKRVIAMYKQGESYQTIGKSIERTESSVANRIARLKRQGKIKNIQKKLWTADEEQRLIDHVKFDEQGYVANYDELIGIVGRRYDQLVTKVAKLRKTGKIKTMADLTTTSVKSKQSMQKFNDARFAQYAKKEEDSMQTEQPMQSRSVTAGSLSIESKEERVIHTVVIFAGVETHTYFSADGTKIAEIQKEPTPVSASVSQQ